MKSSPSKEALVQCDICHALVRRDRLDKHRSKAHSRRPTKSTGIKTVRSQPFQGVAGKQNVPPSPIILISRRRTQTVGWSSGRCDECGKKSEKLTCFPRSNRFYKVFLCDSCIPEVFDRSFSNRRKHRSVWTISAGLPDTNPQRH